MIRRVILYSAEKFQETGAGAFMESFKFPLGTSDEEIKKVIDKRKEDQKEINRKWKEERNDSLKGMMLKKEYIPFEPLSQRVGYEPLSRRDDYATQTLDKFDKLILDEGTGNTLFIVGSSKAGKSYALMKVYEEYYAKDKDFIALLFTDSPQSPHYKNLRKKGLVVCPEGGFNDECKDLIVKVKALQTKLDNPVRFLLMFDDVLNIRYSDVIQKALLVYRNSDISTIISIQYPNLLNKSMRANINNIFLFRFNSDETIEVAIRAFCGSYEPFLSLPSMEQKIKKYKELTLDHHFIYVNPATATIARGRY